VAAVVVVVVVVVENADTKIDEEDDDRQSMLSIFEWGAMIDIIIMIAVIAWISLHLKR